MAVIRNSPLFLRLSSLLVSTPLVSGDLFHVRCSAHILHVVVQEGLAHIHDLLHKIRQTCKYLKKSTQGSQKFERMEVANLVHGSLKIFCDVTCHFSGSNFSTSNVFFLDVCKIQLKMWKWENSGYDYFKEFPLVLGIIVVLDPKLKIDLVEFYYHEIHGDSAYYLYKGSRVPFQISTLSMVVKLVVEMRVILVMEILLLLIEAIQFWMMILQGQRLLPRFQLQEQIQYIKTRPGRYRSESSLPYTQSYLDLKHLIMDPFTPIFKPNSHS
ncbi:hypothetical protein M9H77_35710 [Catharanthus roseus]|uniref:Uncharacterized protein n=1 Tax=Catharanthus roseus TaxID=4058 RepID=A0ACB9ZTI1_CATRO|nr:hypothetical protein M9H77_35710 [Catharanthus roseus]